MFLSNYRTCRAVAIGLAVFSSAVEAQARYDAPNARVEVLGLEKWNLRMLKDSVAHRVKGQQLHDAACMATLRYELMFRDAQVTSYMGYSGEKAKFLSIRVVEPGSNAVQWRKLPVDEFQSLVPDYAKLLLPVTDTAGGIWAGRLMYSFQFRDSATREAAMADAPAAARSDAQHVVTYLASHRSADDRLRAIRSLDSNAFYANRIAAAMILSNFPESDDAWYALVRALRDPHETVRGAAATAIGRMPARAIDWSPVSNDLRLLLGGTNLGAMEKVMNILAGSSVSPMLARTLLKGNDRWVMRLLTSEAPGAPQAAKSLLTALNSGRDLGRSPEAWKAWIAKL